jgi:carbon starvation protein
VIFNERLDAVVCGVFLALVAIIVLDSARVWFGLLRGTRAAVSSESPFIPSNLEAEGA